MDENSLFGVAVLLSIIPLVMCILYCYVAYKAKWEKKFFIASAVILMMTPIMMTIALLTRSDTMIGAALFLPFGVYLLLTAVQLILRYRKCNLPISAKCTDLKFTSSYKGTRYYAPEFEYRYRGTTYKAISFRSYTMRKLENLFTVGWEYTVYINPEVPEQCADKRSFPYSAIVLAIFAAVFIIFGILLMLL